MNSEPETKADSKADPKAEAKNRAKPQSVKAKASILNPAWADEIVHARGINGPLAKAIAADLAKEVALLVSKSFNDEKINKLIGKSFNKNVGM